MADVSLESIVKHFESLADPRDTRNRRHLLVDVIVISVCGVIVGCEGPTAIVRWAKAKKDWLGQVLELPNGIPSKARHGEAVWQAIRRRCPVCFRHLVEEAMRAMGKD